MDAMDMWQIYLGDLHESSGLSYRDIDVRCDLDHSYVARILEGKPSRARVVSLHLQPHIDCECCEPFADGLRFLNSQRYFCKPLCETMM